MAKWYWKRGKKNFLCLSNESRCPRSTGGPALSNPGPPPGLTLPHQRGRGQGHRGANADFAGAENGPFFPSDEAVPFQLPDPGFRLAELRRPCGRDKNPYFEKDLLRGALDWHFTSSLAGGGAFCRPAYSPLAGEGAFSRPAAAEGVPPVAPLTKADIIDSDLPLQMSQPQKCPTALPESRFRSSSPPPTPAEADSKPLSGNETGPRSPRRTLATTRLTGARLPAVPNAQA